MKILYYLLMAVCYPISLLPFWVHYIFADVLYFLIYYVGRYRLKVVRKNLATSFPEKSQEELRRIEKDFYQWFCDYIAETIKLMTMSRREMKRRMVFKNPEALDEVVATGQSVALFLGHYCNWEWVSSIPLWVKPDTWCGQIYHPLENKEFDRLFLMIRERMDAHCISMQDTLREVVKHHREKQPVIIGYISDQKPNWFNIHHWVDFLHHDTPVLTGAERIMRKFDHAVFYVDVHRIRRGYYEGEFKLMTREPKQKEEYELTTIYYQMLEESIKRAPAYWLWSHDRWSRTREEFNRRFEVVDGKVVKRQEGKKEG